MVLDIQGTGYSLYDPEITSTKLLDDDQKTVLFCFGNFAVKQFLSENIALCLELTLPEHASLLK